MEIKDIKETDDTVSFRFYGANLALANALRRVIHAEIPNKAFDEIKFEENQTPFTDEYLAERIRLVPVDPKTKLDQTFILEAEGNSFEPIKVFSKSLAPSLVYPDAYLLPLRIGEKIKLKATLIEGIPKQNVRFQMATIAVSKKEADGSIYFLVESRYTSFYPPKSIVKKGIEALIQKLNIVEKALNRKETTKIEMSYNSSSGLTDTTLYEEDHTLGNLLSNYLMELSPNCYVSYLVPHPLINNVIIKMEAQPDQVKKFLLKVIDYLMSSLRKLMTKF